MDEEVNEEEEDEDLEADFDRGVDLERSPVEGARRGGLTNSGDVVINSLNPINAMTLTSRILRLLQTHLRMQRDFRRLR